MTNATIEVLRAHLLKEGLAICKSSDTSFPLDGFKETEVLREIVSIIEDTVVVDVDSWDDQKTQPIPAAVMQALAERAA